MTTQRMDEIIRRILEEERRQRRAEEQVAPSPGGPETQALSRLEEAAQRIAQRAAIGALPNLGARRREFEERQERLRREAEVRQNLELLQNLGVLEAGTGAPTPAPAPAEQAAPGAEQVPAEGRGRRSLLEALTGPIKRALIQFAAGVVSAVPAQVLSPETFIPVLTGQISAQEALRRQEEEKQRLMGALLESGGVGPGPASAVGAVTGGLVTGGVEGLSAEQMARLPAWEQVLLVSPTIEGVVAPAVQAGRRIRVPRAPRTAAVLEPPAITGRTGRPTPPLAPGPAPTQRTALPPVGRPEIPALPSPRAGLEETRVFQARPGGAPEVVRMATTPVTAMTRRQMIDEIIGLRLMRGQETTARGLRSLGRNTKAELQAILTRERQQAFTRQVQAQQPRVVRPPSQETPTPTAAPARPAPAAAPEAQPPQAPPAEATAAAQAPSPPPGQAGPGAPPSAAGRPVTPPTPPGPPSAAGRPSVPDAGTLWQRLSVPERVNVARQAGLEGRVGSKQWQDISPEAQRLLEPLLRRPSPPGVAGGAPPTVSSLLAGREAPIPPLGQILTDPRPFQESIDIAFHPDNFRRLADKVRDIPVLKQAMRAANPAAVADKPELQAIVAYFHELNEAENQAQRAISFLLQYGSEAKLWGPVDKTGRIAKGPLKGKFLSDIAANPSKYQLTEAQRKAVDAMQQLYRETFLYAKRNGVEIPELQGNFEAFIGRRYVAKVVGDDVLELRPLGPGPSRPGVKLGTQKPRSFATMEEAAKEGFIPMSPYQVLYYRLIEVQKAVSQKRLVDWVLQRFPTRTLAARESAKVALAQAKHKVAVAKRLQDTINDALRGLRPTEATLRSIERLFPNEGARLRAALADPNRSQALRALKNDLTGQQQGKSFFRPIRLAQQQVVQARALARLGREPRAGEMRVPNVPALAGRVFPATAEGQRVAKNLTKAFEFEAVPGWMTALGKVSELGRFMQLTGDAGPLFIQLILVSGWPEKLFRVAAGGVRSVFSPEFHARVLARNADLLKRHPRVLTSLRGTEQTAVLQAGGLLTKGPFRLLGKVYEPFGRLFDTMMDLAAIELLKAYEPLAKTPLEKAQLDDMVNAIRGVISSNKLGISANQRALEAFAALTPRYLRAIAALLAATAQGGVRGRVARNALMRGIIGMHAAFGAAVIAKGVFDGKSPQEIVHDLNESLNPASRRYFLMEVGGQLIGPGSKMVSLINLARNVAITAADSPQDFLSLTMENPLLRWVRAQLGPVPSSAINIWTGRDYIGDPTRDNLLSFARNIGDYLIPIWLQGQLSEAGSLTERMTRGAGEFFGMRAFPMSAFQKFQRYAENITGKPYDQLSRDVLRTLQKQDPIGRELWQAHLEQQAHRGRREEALLEMQRLRQERLDLLRQRAQELTPLQFKELFQKSGADLAAAYRSVRTNPRYQKVFEELESIDPSGIPEDDAIRRYEQIIYDESLVREDGSYDFQERDRRLAQLRLDVGEELWQAIQRYVQAQRADYPPLAQEYLQALEGPLRVYDTLEDKVMSADPYLYSLYLTYRDIQRKHGTHIATKYKNAYPELDSALKRIDQLKETLRRARPDIEAALQKWRGVAPISQRR